MVDVHSPAIRSKNMAAIRGKDTRPEVLLRRALHAEGLRYRLHVGSLPGRPDIVLPGKKSVVFVHGCFFHGHACPSFKWPASNAQFWRSKIEGNKARDLRNIAALRADGWRVFVVWECELRGTAPRERARRLAKRLASAIGASKRQRLVL
ncbi:MAG: DNA mismatch endonuclease Vsr [Steroidobacteraceae bacterium]|nr:DNA mismatch endonuclease Vsr [Steroidobacteraceae bacterium]